MCCMGEDGSEYVRRKRVCTRVYCVLFVVPGVNNCRLDIGGIPFVVPD